MLDRYHIPSVLQYKRDSSKKLDLLEVQQLGGCVQLLHGERGRPGEWGNYY